MLVLDQIKKEDPQLRFLAIVILAGMLLLLGGLWWVQLVSTKYYQEKAEVQSIRTVEIPAVRGKILDRDGRALAENHPSYNVDLYLEELSKDFQGAYAAALGHATTNAHLAAAARQKQLGRKLTSAELKQFGLSAKFKAQFPTPFKAQLQEQTRYEVVSNIVAGLSARLQLPINVTPKDFQTRYETARAFPMPVLAGLNPVGVARFEEQSMSTPGVDLDVQSLRTYPNGPVAFHVLGYLHHRAEDAEGTYNYRLPDFEGVSGIESLCDDELRGEAASKSVLVNNLGYRQSEHVWSPPKPGNNVILTIDMDVQIAAETALHKNTGATGHGAVVVMDVRNGDILAMASAPTFNPDHFTHRPEPAVWRQEVERWNDEVLKVQMNRATQENYEPGSIFKIMVGLAALEKGVLNPKQVNTYPGYSIVGKRTIRDHALAGSFDFDSALARSSNAYFIEQGLKPGVLAKLIELTQRLHLAERTGLFPHQEAPGHVPDLAEISSDSWHDGDTANTSIGQAKVYVTPLQMAVMTAAVANGGKVLWPHLISRIESIDGSTPAQVLPPRGVRDDLGVSRRNLQIVHEAMAMDVESPHGTGHGAAIPGFWIAGKTGTADVERQGHVDNRANATWFVSFGPAEPRYAVVVMVEGSGFGSGLCVPVAREIYLALIKSEARRTSKPGVLAQIK